MTQTVHLACPKYGSQAINEVSEVGPQGDFPPAVCGDCGYALTQDEIREQIIAIADKNVMRALGDIGLK